MERPWAQDRGGPLLERFGELVQWDTSEHDWLEGRAAGALPLWEYLEKNGWMVDVYTDCDSMFTAAARAGESEQQRIAADRLTQIGRGLRELGIVWMPAYSTQAKGRIERSFSHRAGPPGERSASGQSLDHGSGQ